MQTPTVPRNKLIKGVSDGCPPPLPISIMVRPTLFTLNHVFTIVSPVDSPSASTNKVPRTVPSEKSPYPIKALPQPPKLHSMHNVSHTSNVSSCPESPGLEPRPFGPKSFVNVVADSPGLLEDDTLTKLMSNSTSLYECLRPLLNPLFEEDFKPTPDLFFSNREENDACFMNNFHDIDPLPFDNSGRLMVAPSDVPSRRSSSSSCTEAETVASTKQVRLRASHLEQWDQRFKELAHFRMENGHALVPLHYPANPRLSHWIKR
jgi:hypothetical protein